MKTLLSTLCGLMFLASCASPPPPPVVVPRDYLPAGSKVQFFGQVYDCSWQPVGCIPALSRPMSIREAEQWAMSAAQQRLGNHWRDFRIVATPFPEGPAIIWQRRHYD